MERFALRKPWRNAARRHRRVHGVRQVVPAWRPIYNAIRSAKRVGDIARFGMPSSVRRAFDKLDRFPRGLVPLKNSVRRFPPT